MTQHEQGQQEMVQVTAQPEQSCVMTHVVDGTQAVPNAISEVLHDIGDTLGPRVWVR